MTQHLFHMVGTLGIKGTTSEDKAGLFYGYLSVGRDLVWHQQKNCSSDVTLLVTSKQVALPLAFKLGRVSGTNINLIQRTAKQHQQRKTNKQQQKTKGNKV